MRTVITLLALSAATPLAAASENGRTFSIAMHEDHGPYLVAPNGKPVYAMITEGRGGDGLAPLLSCKQRCLTDWPLVTSAKPPKADEGLVQSDFLTVEWEGEQVVKYNGWTLFYYTMEDGDGTPDGHAISTYGGWWALMSPDGQPIRSGIIPEADNG